MSRITRCCLGLAAIGLAVVPVPFATAADEVEVQVEGTQFLPLLTQVPAGAGVAWANKEAANYPVLIGNHNIVPDTVAGALPGNKPFPTSSPLIEPGQRWACAGGAGGPTCVGIDGKPVQLAPGRYAYMCGLHPNHMHGVLVVS